MTDVPRAGRAGEAEMIRWHTRLRITLDGVEQRRVVAYDCDAGWIERGVRDSDDRLVLNDDEVVMERLYGVVDVGIK